MLHGYLLLALISVSLQVSARSRISRIAPRLMALLLLHEGAGLQTGICPRVYSHINPNLGRVRPNNHKLLCPRSLDWSECYEASIP